VEDELDVSFVQVLDVAFVSELAHVAFDFVSFRGVVGEVVPDQLAQLFYFQVVQSILLFLLFQYQ
jgi:hypothetical protein